LRRGALGLVRILREAQLPLVPRQLLHLAAEQLRQQDVVVDDEVMAAVEAFVLERARSYFRESGQETGVINAAMASSWTSLPDLAARMEALSSFMGQASAPGLAAANKRIGNILRKSESEVSDTIAVDKFVLDEEKHLFAEVDLAAAALAPWLEKADYAACLSRLAELGPAVDRFFDAVMVMDEDPALRRNRLALLARLKALFDAIADVSVLA